MLRVMANIIYIDRIRYRIDTLRYWTETESALSVTEEGNLN